MRLWDLERGVPLATLTGHRAPVEAVAVSPDGGCIVSGDADGRLRFWDTDRDALAARWPAERVLSRGAPLVDGLFTAGLDPVAVRRRLQSDGALSEQELRTALLLVEARGLLALIRSLRTPRAADVRRFVAEAEALIDRGQ